MKSSSARLVHALRGRLQQGAPSLVVNVDHPSPSLVEYLGQLPLEAVMFDTEQGSPDFETVENMARAARVAGVCSLARTFNGEPWAIERPAGLHVDAFDDDAGHARAVIVSNPGPGPARARPWL